MPPDRSTGDRADASVGATARTGAATQVLWLRVDPRNPSAIFIAGHGGCHALDIAGSHICLQWIMRSTNAGTTWSSIRSLLPNEDGFYDADLTPIQIAPDSRHMYMDAGTVGITPAGEFDRGIASTDGGATWYGTQYTNLSISPIHASRLYGALLVGLSGGFDSVGYSDTAGAGWHNMGDPSVFGMTHSISDSRPWGGEVADPRYLDTVYVNNSNYFTGKPAFVSRTDDLGLHWTMVITPTATPPLRTFSLSIDLHEGTQLVGRTQDPGVPPDRRYLSNDEGQTWKPTTCPGDWQGVCPTFTVDNVFGAGASYAFVNNGIYVFHGGAAALRPLAIGSRLPVPTSDLIDVQAGTKEGQPVYLLTRQTVGAVSGVIYRSTDKGLTWQRLDGIFPNYAPSMNGSGALYVPQTHHSVAPAFVRTYRRVGIYIVGYPLTEGFWNGATYTQVFEHARLELRHGQVSFGSMAREIFFQTPYDPLRQPVKKPAPIGKHFLSFWQAHGGIKVLGRPLSVVFKSMNGDGSGRVYEMQWFDNARLEWHPEVKNPAFAVLLGLTGREWLANQGWTPWKAGPT